MAADSHLESVLVGGPEPAVIVLQEDHRAWAARFRQVRDEVLAVLGDRVVDVLHIGSTAVPGLAAKPVVDVLVTVPDVADDDAYVPALRAAGFALRVVEPGHRMLRTPARDVHLHVRATGDPAVTDHLLFRDRLLRSAADRQLYERTKRDLATRRWADMNHYAEAKSAVVREILCRARQSASL
ncbi:GrpB family protein [Blastococcus sp. SYSU DS0552]